MSFNLHHISWKDRKSTIFWRGSCNNPLNLFSVRIKLVKKLFNYSDSDVKFINYKNQYILKNYLLGIYHAVVNDFYISKVSDSKIIK